MPNSLVCGVSIVRIPPLSFLPSFVASDASGANGKRDGSKNVRVTASISVSDCVCAASASYAAASTHASVRECTSTMAAAPRKPAPPLAPCSRRTSHVSHYAIAAAQPRPLHTEEPPGCKSYTQPLRWPATEKTSSSPPRSPLQCPLVAVPAPCSARPCAARRGGGGGGED